MQLQHHQCIQKPWNQQFLNINKLFLPLELYGHIFSNFIAFPTAEDLNSNLPSFTNWSGVLRTFIEQGSSRFNPQKTLLSGKLFALDNLYEPRIFLKGEIPTRRNNWHDFFNALIWATFPKTKAALNMRHFIAYDEMIVSLPFQKTGKNRTREQDRLTLFDEGGAIVIKSGSIENVIVFGHAVYECMFNGEKEMSLAAIELNFYQNEINFQELYSKEVLSIIDNNLASIVSQRETFLNAHFKTVQTQNWL
jgi:hypothetical protein